MILYLQDICFMQVLVAEQTVYHYSIHLMCDVSHVNINHYVGALLDNILNMSFIALQHFRYLNV